jgi:serine/threonine-protein kinase
VDTGNPVASDAAAAAPDDLLQQALGAAYVLEAEIGRGGMARVYRAHDRKHDRPVALKVLHPDVAQTLGSERFRREIRLAARLQHPHIVPVFDSGDAAGRLWFTMPLVSGESLRDRLAQARQLAVDDAVRLAREVALALEYAHGQGVVHRDVKPENILLTADGQTLLGDFGIARRSGAEGEAAGGGMTGTGFSVGTPAYMSPEQGAGDPHVDGRSDQYALACVLYECLAGEPPFTGPTPQAVLAKRFASPAPDVSVLRDGVAPGVRAALARALARSPADRFPTTAAFAAALADAHAPHPPGPTQATAASPRPRRRVGAVALGIAALAAGAAAVFAWRTAERASVAPLAATSVPVASKQLTFSGAAEDPALSPDGRQVAYVETRCASEAGRACVTELRVQDVASGQSGALTSAEVVLSPQWSPDGAWLLTLMLQTDGEPGMYLTPRLGGSTRRVAPVGVTAFSVTGDTILFVGQAAPGAAAFLQRIRAATGAALDSMPLPPSISRPTAIVPSPDGRRLAVRVGERLMLATPDGRVTDSLPFRFRGTLRWDPRGDALYAFKPGVGINDWLLRARVDGARGRFAGGVDTVLSLATVNTGTFDITRDGRTLVHTGGTTTSTLWAVDLDARPATPRRLAASTSWLDVPYLSSTGSSSPTARRTRRATTCT